MTNQHRPDAGLWDDEDDDDNEQTQVAPNPALRGATALSGTTPVSGLLARRTVSSFGPPARVAGHAPADRRSLYDRLLESGALDEVMATAAEESAHQPLQLSQLGQKVASNDAGLADLAETLEPTRDSALELRDSDLQLVRQRDSDGFVSALSRDPEEPVVLGKPSKGAALPPPPARPPLPSVVLGPHLSTRYDATERVSIPRTHPLANSLAPAASIKSAPPAAPSRSKGWLIGLGAAALVGLGVVGLATQRGADRAQGELARSAAAAPVASPQADVTRGIAPAPKLEAALVAVPPAPEPSQPVEGAKAAEPSALEASSEPAPKAISTSESQPEAADEPAERSHHHHRRSSEPRGEADAAKAEAASAATAERPTASVPAPAKAEKADKGGDASLPTQPSREQVVAAMGAVLPSVKECVGDKHGATTVTVTVRPAGFVSYAIVGGAFAGTAEGSCIARVVKEAVFPAFSDPFVRITYPYQL